MEMGFNESLSRGQVYEKRKNNNNGSKHKIIISFFSYSTLRRLGRKKKNN